MRFPKLAIQPRHITGTAAGRAPVFRGAYIDAATRPPPVCAPAYVAPASRRLCALLSAFSLCAHCAEHAVTLPPDGNNATGRPAARGIEQAPRGGCLHSEETAGHCPSLGDSVRHGSGRHILSARAAAGAPRTEPPWIGTPPSP